MIITFIGMAGSGKSYWAKRLEEEYSYRLIPCDLLIEQKFFPGIEQDVSLGAKKLSSWLGLPWEAGFQEREALCLSAEETVMREVLSELEKNIASGEDIVVDTSGSVVYCSDIVWQKLRNLSTILYFESSAEHIAELFHRFQAKPRPLIWGGRYQQKEGETQDEALQRSFGELVSFRRRLYEELAELRLPFTHYHSEDFSLAMIIEACQTARGSR